MVTYAIIIISSIFWNLVSVWRIFTIVRDVSHDEVPLIFFVSCRPDDVGNECSPEFALNTSF